MLAPSFSLMIEYLSETIEGNVRASVGFVSLVIEVVSREHMAASLTEEKNRPAVYILLGEVSGRQKIYIGQASKIKTRLRDHERNKEWFKKIVLIYRENHFNSAHYKYLEAKLIREAKKAIEKNRNYTLENAQIPDEEALSRSAISECEQFLSYIYRVLPALRIDIFYQKEEHSPLIPIKEKKEEKKTEEIKDPVFILKRKKGCVLARMMIREGKYYLLENSHLVLKSAWTNTVPPSLGSKYDKLCSKNMLIEKEEYCLVAEEIEFSSSSAAAMIVYGAGVGGPALWRLEGTNMTLKKWQAEKEAQEVRLETGEGEQLLALEARYKNLIFILEVKKYGIKGRMWVENEKSFIILAGSQSMGQWDGAGSQKAAMDKQYHFLKNQQILQKDGESWIFIKDYICASPSLAAQLIAGSIRGGWLTWQDEKTGALLDRWRYEIKKTCNKGENKSYS